MKGALGKKELGGGATVMEHYRPYGARREFLNAGISPINAAHGTVMKLSVGLMNVRQQARQSSGKNLLFSNVYIVL